MKRVAFGFIMLAAASNCVADGLTNAKSVKIYKDHIATAAPAPISEQPSWLDNFSGYMTLTSNYVFRGQTQTLNRPAMQGSLTYTFPVGIYLNVWGSNVHSLSIAGDEVEGVDGAIQNARITGATIELDTIAGYRNTIGDNFSYDLSLARYNYPKAREVNYNEFIALANFYFLQASMAYTNNYSGTHTTSRYYNGGVNYNIPCKYLFGINDVNVTALIGHSDFSSSVSPNYNDYSVAVSKKLKNYVLAVQWTGTNGNLHNPPIDRNQLIASVTANF